MTEIVGVDTGVEISGDQGRYSRLTGRIDEMRELLQLAVPDRTIGCVAAVGLRVRIVEVDLPASRQQDASESDALAGPTSRPGGPCTRGCCADSGGRPG